MSHIFRFCALLVALLIIDAEPFSAQPAPCRFEESPAVGRLRTVLAAIRQPDRTTLRTSIEAIWSADSAHREALDAAVVSLSRLMLQGRGFGELRLCTPRPDLAIAVLRNDLTDAADQVALEVGAGKDAPAVRVVATLATRQLVSPPSAAPDPAKAEALRAYVTRLAEHGAFSGVVLIGHAGSTVTAGAWGQANRDTRQPITLDTPFNLASASKMFTAVAAMQLVEAGRLSLDEEVAPILAITSTDPRFAQVRVMHLLSHASGLDRDPNQLAFAPGTSFFYSNTGFRLLGDIVARRSGMRFEDYLRLKVFGPAGMASTGRYEMTAPSPLLTFGYTLEKLGDADAGRLPDWKPNPYLQTISGGGMGGLYSTGADMLRFASALNAGRHVTSSSVELMKTPRSELGAPSYGFGVMRYRTPGVWGHGGDLPGADAAIEFYSDDYVAIVLANMDNVAAPIVQTTRALFHRHSPPA
jgi:CubicO group peptidase (beta-lactamase class C family)